MYYLVCSVYIYQYNIGIFMGGGLYSKGAYFRVSTV